MKTAFSRPSRYLKDPHRCRTAGHRSPSAPSHVNADAWQESSFFSLRSDSGDPVSLASFKGKKVVLYFYPKDDTSGCTVEACEFRDSWAAVKKAGAVVLGVSPDGVASHVKFKKKFDLPFPLLADPDHAVAERFGVWGEKSMYGRKYFGINRTTFVIDEEGKILKVFEKVKPKGHAAEVLEVIQ